MNKTAKKKSPGNMKDLVGKQFGRLTVLKDSGRRSGNNIKWECLCQCGNTTEVRGSHLTQKLIRSCGCLNKELASKRLREYYSKGRKGENSPSYKHGDSFSRLYFLYHGMRNRCHNPNSNGYEYYGSRGIGVCDEWRENYLAFKFWAILNGFQEGLSIDRINNDGNYEPDNCQWVTLSENSRKSNRQRKERRIQDENLSATL